MLCVASWIRGPSIKLLQVHQRPRLHHSHRGAPGLAHPHSQVDTHPSNYLPGTPLVGHPGHYERSVAPAWSLLPLAVKDSQESNSPFQKDPVTSLIG